MQMFILHSKQMLAFFFIIFSWVFTSFILSLSKRVQYFHPYRCLVYILQADVGVFKAFHVEFPFFHTLTLKQVLYCNSPCRCLVYTIQADVGFSLKKSFSMRFHIYFIPSLSKQVLNYHSPCRCLVYTFHADVGFFMGFDAFIFFEVSYFSYCFSKHTT